MINVLCDAADDATAFATDDVGRETGEEIESADTVCGAGMDVADDAGIQKGAMPTPSAAPCLTPGMAWTREYGEKRERAGSTPSAAL